ncbi:hypothetical protein [Massilia niabensis]|uniref:Uncharacterized protein n=1 Tax=Massilia niabensis TaxID=544910 RepID=A0ABW0L4V5_9BURK
MIKSDKVWLNRAMNGAGMSKRGDCCLRTLLIHGAGGFTPAGASRLLPDGLQFTGTAGIKRLPLLRWRTRMHESFERFWPATRRSNPITPRHDQIG